MSEHVRRSGLISILIHSALGCALFFFVPEKSFKRVYLSGATELMIEIAASPARSLQLPSPSLPPSTPALSPVQSHSAPSVPTPTVATTPRAANSNVTVLNQSRRTNRVLTKPQSTQSSRTLLLAQEQAHPEPSGVPVSSMAARTLHSATPVYSEASRRKGEEGQVVLSVEVLLTGMAGEIRLDRSSGYERLDRAAVDAARKSRFAPALAQGKPVSSRKKLAYTFALTQPDTIKETR